MVNRFHLFVYKWQYWETKERGIKLWKTSYNKTDDDNIESNFQELLESKAASISKWKNDPIQV